IGVAPRRHPVAESHPELIVLAAHDWGGAIAMGWAVDHVDRLAGMVLCNTGITVPEGRVAPRLIQLAGAPWLRRAVCAVTPTFVEGTTRLSRGALDRRDRAAFRAPYRRREHREAIADFVGDVPLRSPHPSEAALGAVAARLGEIDVPVLLAWGSADPVFDDDFAADLAGRLPQAVLQRFPAANHLVMAEADVAGAVELWLSDLGATESVAERSSSAANLDEPLWGAVQARAEHDPDGTALADLATGRASTWAALDHRITAIAVELRRRGLHDGDRVAVLTPPSVEQIAVVYGVWRAGGVTVLADRGLGLRGLGRAVRSARAPWVIGPARALAAARALRWATGATRVRVEELVAAADARAASVSDDAEPLPIPQGTDEAAVLFTSGATGPAKGVRYLHAQLGAQRDALARTYGISVDDRLVAAFAPFALYGPALGIGTALPDCDVTAPGSLTAEGVEAAVARIGATLVFASPAALANVAATATERTPTVLSDVRTVMSAGAPVPSELLRSIARLAPSASLHTPYGMTESLPVADVDFETIARAEETAPAAGVCVGRPVEGVEVRVVPLDFDPATGVPDAVGVGRMGELLVRSPWTSDGYEGLWATQRSARPGHGWHRTGDVGHIDDHGLLWVEGRAVHVIHAVDGAVASVPIERAVESSDLVGVTPGRIAAVGVGPVGVQQVVVVVERSGTRRGMAGRALTDAVRGAVPIPIAAVLVVPALPVDIRHNAKIDRVAVGAWASRLLAGTDVASQGADH
ncbi:MAG: alpha/beta fold hydrolase, partial [Actinomycetota bacterium]